MNYRGSKLLMGFLGVLVKVFVRPRAYDEDGRRIQGHLDEPTIIVANHIAHIDGSIVNTLFRHQVIHHLAAKDRFEQSRWLHWLLTQCGCIPIDRKGVDTSWIHQSIDILRNDRDNICIFPEGLRSHDGTILPFHSGVTMITALAGAPIVLVYNDGPYDVIHHNRLMVSAPFRLDPPTAGLTAEYIQAQTDLLHDRMTALQQRFKELDPRG